MAQTKFSVLNRELHNCLSFEEIQDWLWMHKDRLVEWYIANHPGVDWIRNYLPTPTEMLFVDFSSLAADWTFSLWSRPYNHVLSALILPRFGIRLSFTMSHNEKYPGMIGASFKMEKAGWPVMEVHERLSK